LLALALLWQTTLLSPGLVGTDIHTEYFFFKLAYAHGWDWTLPHAYNSAIGTTLLAPLLARFLAIFHIPDVWVFKAIYPAIFALVPVLLYQTFKRDFGITKSFWAVVFFVIVPTWSMELIGLPRQQLAEVMLAVVLWLVIACEWRMWVRVSLVILAGILGSMFHYSIGTVIWFYLGAGTILLWWFRRHKDSNKGISVRWMLFATCTVIVVALGYYAVVCQGEPLRQISTSVVAQVQRVIHTVNPALFPPIKQYTDPTTGGAFPVPVQLPDTNLITGQEPLIRTALGLDFMTASLWGKVFRIVQFVTEALIVIGFIQIIRKRKQYSPEYLAIACAGALLLVACLVIPRFSSIMNATRFYHVALFGLAPAFVVGATTLWRGKMVLAIVVIIVYFAFTSGAIFELTKQTDTSSINLPYSILLSGKRLDLGGIPTKNDLIVRDWIVDNKAFPVYEDINGTLLLDERMPWYTWEKSDGYLRMPLKTSLMPAGSYVFLREANVKGQEIMLMPEIGEAPATGMRASHSWQSIGLDKVVEDGDVVYRSGNAMVVRIK
jgi:uncharacterized membrane protein